MEWLPRPGVAWLVFIALSLAACAPAVGGTPRGEVPREAEGHDPDYATGDEPFSVEAVPQGFEFTNRQKLTDAGTPDEFFVRFQRPDDEGARTSLIITALQGRVPTLSEYRASSHSRNVPWDDLEVRGNDALYRPGEMYWVESSNLSFYVTTRARGNVPGLSLEEFNLVAEGIQIKR